MIHYSAVKTNTFFFILLILFVNSTPLWSAEKTGIVTRVYDGDTLILHGERVRLLGVDTPETNKTKRLKSECYAKEAKDYLSMRVLNEKIHIKTDPKAAQKDIYGRILAYVYLGDENINGTLIEKGYGFVYMDGTYAKKADFIKRQKKAKRYKRGIWKHCSVDCTSRPYCQVEP